MRQCTNKLQAIRENHKQQEKNRGEKFKTGSVYKETIGSDPT